MKKTTKRFALGTLIAVAAGYLAGILTAPKSGKETRKEIKDTANQGIAAAERELKQLHTELGELLNKAKAEADKLTGKAKADFSGALDMSAKAKGKAREMLSAVHEGDTDDKELKKAIGDAKKAIDHLKSYLAK